MRDSAWQIVQTQGGYMALWRGLGASLAYTVCATGILYGFEVLSGL